MKPVFYVTKCESRIEKNFNRINFFSLKLCVFSVISVFKSIFNTEFTEMFTEMADFSNKLREIFYGIVNLSARCRRRVGFLPNPAKILSETRCAGGKSIGKKHSDILVSFQIFEIHFHIFLKPFRNGKSYYRQ